ncbi:MAG TPA: hypothetical protein VK012_02860 [Gemmatimonadales bacterium]|nr:hypothetical protein [Gemmatimonadales bacterium]
MIRGPARLAVLLLAAVCAAWAVASLWWPFQSDHGVYAWMADVVLQGGMPYRDAWDVKGPTALVPSLAAQLLTGRTTWGIRALDLLMVGATAAAIYRILAAWTSRSPAAITALLWILLYASVGFAGTAQPDGFWSMLLLLGVTPWLRERRVGPVALVLVGAVIAGLTLLKPIYLAFAILPVIGVVMPAPADRRVPRDLGLLAAGYGAACVIVVGGLAAGGAFDPFIDAYISFNVAKNSGGLAAHLLSSLSDGIVAQPLWIILLAAAVAGAVALHSIHPRAAVMLGAWIVAALITIHLQRPFYAYRLHLISPALAVLAGFGLARAAQAGGASRVLAAALACGVALIVGRAPAAQAAHWAWHVPGPGSRTALLERSRFLSTTGAGERRLVQTFASGTDPDDRVYAFRHPAVYFLADREAASRLSIYAAFGAGAPAGYVERHRDELAQDLESAPPRMIALPDDDTVQHPCLGCFEPLSGMPESASRLAPRYRLLRRADGFVVFIQADSLPTEPRLP